MDIAGPWALRWYPNTAVRWDFTNSLRSLASISSPPLTSFRATRLILNDMPIRQDLSPYEHHMRAFLARTGTDLDAQAVVFNLHHAARDLIATMDSLALRPHDLTHAGFVVLMMIWSTGPRETREPAPVLGVTRGAIVGSVNTLEKRGLVRRLR